LEQINRLQQINSLTKLLETEIHQRKQTKMPPGITKSAMKVEGQRDSHLQEDIEI
jgi:hypothetical protein